jgi:hypothetical protein
MRQAQSLEIGALGWTSIAASERMMTMTTSAAIPTLRPMLRPTGHHLDHRNPHTTPLHDQDRSRNLPGEELQPLRKTKMRTNGVVSTSMPKSILSARKDLACLVERVLLRRTGKPRTIDKQDDKVVVTAKRDLALPKEGDRPSMFRRHAHLSYLPATPHLS